MTGAIRAWVAKKLAHAVDHVHHAEHAMHVALHAPHLKELAVHAIAIAIG